MLRSALLIALAGWLSGAPHAARIASPDEDTLPDAGRLEFQLTEGAEVELLRAELDMLKRAFRLHCLETM